MYSCTNIQNGSGINSVMVKNTNCHTYCIELWNARSFTLCCINNHMPHNGIVIAALTTNNGNSRTDNHYGHPRSSISNLQSPMSDFNRSVNISLSSMITCALLSTNDNRLLTNAVTLIGAPIVTHTLFHRWK